MPPAAVRPVSSSGSHGRSSRSVSSGPPPTDERANWSAIRWSPSMRLDAGGPQHERPPVTRGTISRLRQFDEAPCLSLRQVGPPDREAGFPSGDADDET